MSFRILEDRLPKRALNGRMYGKTPKGRPRKRWEEHGEEWRQTRSVGDRDIEAKVQFGP